MAIEKTAGFFAREVLKRFSQMPIEDELRQNNAKIRDHVRTWNSAALSGNTAG